MSRYIDADAFDERVRISVGLVEEELTDDYKDGVRCTLELLKTEPRADVVEVKHGKWIDHKCSLCEFEPYDPSGLDTFNFCSNCGADMRGTKK